MPVISSSFSCKNGLRSRKGVCVDKIRDLQLGNGELKVKSTFRAGVKGRDEEIDDACHRGKLQYWPVKVRALPQ
jgi:hypothetical protein